MEEREDKKISVSSTASRMEAFAARIREWNSGLNVITVVIVFVFLLMLTLYGICMNVNEIFTEQLHLLVIEIITLTVICSMYVLWHILSYIFVNGKEGKMIQDIIFCLRYMPFSAEEYFEWIYNKMKKSFLGLGIAVFVITFAGCFCYAQNNPLDDSIALIAVEIQEAAQVLYYLLIAACKAIFFVGSMHMWFHFYKRLFCGEIREEKGKQSKVAALRQKVAQKVRKVSRGIRVVIMFIMGFALVFGLMLLTDWIYQTYYGAESVYLITNNLSMLAAGLLTLIFELVVEIGFGFEPDMEVEIDYKSQLSENSFFRKKISTPLIVGGIILILGIGFECTSFVYNRFTLEGVEEHRITGTRTYSWEDVEKCTIKTSWSGYLMLQFEMKDGSKMSYKESEWGMEYESQAFAEQFASEQYSSTELYIMWLTEKMVEQGVSFQADWEKLENKLISANEGWIEEVREIIEMND